MHRESSAFVLAIHKGGHCIVSVLALNGTSPSPQIPPPDDAGTRAQPAGLSASWASESPLSHLLRHSFTHTCSFSSSHFILIFISHKTGVDLAPSVAWLLVAICDTISFLHISHLYQSLLRNNANAHPVCKKERPNVECFVTLPTTYMWLPKVI